MDIAGVGRVVYTDDIGHGRSPLMNKPAGLENTDFLIIESTYGAKQHRRRNQKRAWKK